MHILLRAKLISAYLIIVLLVNLLLAFPALGNSPSALSSRDSDQASSVVASAKRNRVNSALNLPPVYEYTSFYGAQYGLFPYEGTHVALLVPEAYYDPTVLSKITQAVDRAYEYYAQATGHEPPLAQQYHGLTTIAAIPEVCPGAAACGNVGATGIELQNGTFDLLFRSVADHNQFDQVVFYELGRNFWFHENKVAYLAQDAVATGFAVFMRFMAMEAAGVTGAPYDNKDFETFKAEVKGLLPLYLADPAFNWSNTLAISKSPMAGYGGTDMFASFLFALRARFGDDFLMKIWREVDQGPERTTTQDAVNNFVAAASRAAGQDLSELFAYTWRWPVSSKQPFTIPALREWTAAPDVYTFTANTRIVIDSAELQNTATIFANDLRDLSSFTIPVVQGSVPATGDIVLALGATDSTIGNEGYLMEVGGTTVVRARTDSGVFYGTRTILQLLKQGYTVVGGVARDWPSFPERSMMVDNGRKYFSPIWLKNHIRELAYLKYNYFHLHLSDDQGFHLESNTVAPTAPIISKAELTDLIALASQYHITIVPEIDMPGHMAAILPAQLRLPYDDGEITAPGYLNIASDEGYTFAQQLIEEYSPLFPGPYWHMGGDEFSVDWGRLNHLRDYARANLNNPNATALDGFIAFVNHTNQLIKTKGKQLRMWSNPLDGDKVLQFDHDIILELWDLSVNPNDAINRGYTIMNSSFYPTYYVQGWEKQDPARPQYPAAALYDQWTPQKFFAEQFPPYSLTAAPYYTLAAPPSAQLLGGKFHIWSDNPTAQTEKQVAAGIYAKLRAMAQNNWGSPKLAVDYATFESMLQGVDHAPGYVQPITQPYDFAGEIVDPNNTIPSDHYGNLTGDGTFGWQTKNCEIDVRTNGFLFTLDSGAGNSLTYSGVIDGNGRVALRAAPAGSPVEMEPIILSGDLPNRYSGVTTLKRGIVQLAKSPGVAAIPGDLVMENQGANDELRWAASDQIADSANLTINSTAGKLNLNGFQETIGELKMANGAVIDTGTGSNGELIVTHLWYNDIAIATGTYTAADAAYVKGGGRLIVLQSASPTSTPTPQPTNTAVPSTTPTPTATNPAQAYNFAGEIPNPNATIPDGFYGNLTGNGSYGWQTGSSSKDLQTNGFAFTLHSGNGNPLNYSGVIYGAGQVNINAGPAGSGCCAYVPVILSGERAQQYTGVTTLQQGVVELAKPNGVTAIPGDLVMLNQGANDELRWAASDQIADSANLTINSTAGKLNLNGFQETIHKLQMAVGARLETSLENGGTLTVTQFWYGDMGYGAGTYTAATEQFLTGSGRLVVLQSSSNLTKIKIMPLGDSITYISSSYRGLILTQLRQAGYNVDMVGTLSDPAEGGDDPDHEGRNGATIGFDGAYEWGDNPATGYKNNLYALVPTFMTQNPDVILLLIGTNDYTNYQSETGASISYDANTQSPPKLAGLIDRILAEKPDVKILVASLLPVSTARSEERNVGPFNAAIPGIVAERAAAGKQVYFVDMNMEAGIDPNNTAQLYDGLHPTIAGSQKMATVWFNHLKPILDASSPPTSTPTPTPTSTPSSRLIAVSAPTNAAAAPSQPFTLPLTIDSDVSGLQIFAYQFRLTFNPAVLQVTGVANSGTLSSNWQITEHHGTPGQIDVAGYGTTPLTGMGVLLNLAFQVAATAGAETDLTLSHFLFNEGSPVAAPHNGHISVRLLGTAGLVTYTLNAQPVPDVLLTLSRANQFTTTSSSTINGEYQLVAPQIGNYTLAPSKQGSEGNAITAYDASLVARCVVGALDIDTCPLEASDSSNNGQIAAYDAALIARYVVHLPTTNSLVGQWKFSPPVRLYQPLDRDFTGQNFNAILVGDVSGNWAATASSLQAAATPVHLRLVSAPTTDGQPLQSTLRLDRAQRTDLFAYQVVIAYDPAVLQVLQVADAARLPGWSFVANADTPGQLQVVGYGTTPLSVDGDLLNLTFQQITTAVDTPFIGISTAQINEEQTSVVIETPAPQRTLFLPLVIR